jgi:hypothetical protein
MATRGSFGTRTSIRLHTKDRDAGSSVNQPRWTLARPISAFSSQVIACSIPNTMTGLPGVAGFLWVDTTLGNVSIPDRVYSPATLAAEVQAALLALDVTFTCVYDQTRQYFTISRTGIFGLLFATGTHAGDANGSLASTLGYAQADVTVAASYTSTLATMLTEPSVVLLRSAGLSTVLPVDESASWD